MKNIYRFDPLFNYEEALKKWKSREYLLRFKLHIAIGKEKELLTKQLRITRNRLKEIILKYKRR